MLDIIITTIALGLGVTVAAVHYRSEITEKLKKKER